MTHIPPVPKNDYERMVLRNVEQYGWHCTAVAADADAGTPPFAYTVGLAKSGGQPEILVRGLVPAVAHSMLSACAARLAEGLPLPLGAALPGLIDGLACSFVELPPEHYADYMLTALWWHGGQPFVVYELLSQPSEG
jgi:hypothetical protein